MCRGCLTINHKLSNHACTARTCSGAGYRWTVDNVSVTAGKKIAVSQNADMNIMITKIREE